MTRAADGRPSGAAESAFDAAVRAHDALVEARGVAIWLGGEPTFTDRFSDRAEWIWDGPGRHKEERARALIARLARERPGAALVRATGKQYPGEETPRWCYGLLWRRDCGALWEGPPDPLLGVTTKGRAAAEPDAARFSAALEARVRSRDVTASAPRVDRIAEATFAADAGTLRVELPEVASSEQYVALLDDVSAVARELGAGALVIVGSVPPADASIAWMSVVPDPAVVEVNTAPAVDASGFLRELRSIYSAARGAGLAPMRLHYNGDVADSGGGGQLTLGGPSPEESPFFRHPKLLPRLIAYLDRHPSLSWFFAFDAVGGTSQAPRVDEGGREMFEEIQLAIELLGREERPAPATIAASLAPFLTDRVGNTHRSEINVEKLWNPAHPHRGQLGLVELRALRMARDPARATAIAVLFRALAAYLATLPERASGDADPAGDPTVELVDHGADLHDRFALPFFLRLDLEEVLAELDAAGLALSVELRERLLDDAHRLITSAPLGPVHVEIRRAIEFWPVIGDQTAHVGGSRLVDASTARVELVLRPLTEDSPPLTGLTLGIDGYRVEPVLVSGRAGPAAVLGVRYRAFLPERGLHPNLPAHGPLSIDVFVESGEGFRITFHPWLVGGGVYDGLPRDLEDAARRRRERLVLEPVPDGVTPDTLRRPPVQARTAYTLDTRWLRRPGATNSFIA